MLVYGKNVLLSTNPKTIKRVYLSDNFKDETVYEFLKTNKVRYEKISLKQMNQMCNNKNHQGVVFIKDQYQYCEFDTLLNESFLVLLDHLEDPHNFGAIIRTCEALGVGGIIIPKDRNVIVTDTVIKISTGAIEQVKIAKVTNLVDTIKKLKNAGFYIYGSAMDGTDCRQVQYEAKKVLVIGNEGKGMSFLVTKQCDEILKIPMKGTTNSLNASVAAGILIFTMEG